MSQCRRMHRDGRGQPWVQCTQRAVAVLWKGATKCGPYCLECCNYFTNVFPVRTFNMVFLPDEETSNEPSEQHPSRGSTSIGAG